MTKLGGLEQHLLDVAFGPGKFKEPIKPKIIMVNFYLIQQELQTMFKDFQAALPPKDAWGWNTSGTGPDPFFDLLEQALEKWR